MPIKQIIGIILSILGTVSLVQGFIAFVELNNRNGDGGLGDYGTWMGGLVLSAFGVMALSIGLIMLRRKIK